MRFVLITVSILTLFSCARKEVTLVVPDDASPRVRFGAEKLAGSLEAAGYQVRQTQDTAGGEGMKIVIGKTGDELPAEPDQNLRQEGFTIRRQEGENQVRIQGADASGALYGCLELSDRIKEGKRLPEGLNITDQPEMVLRGACIGLQKTEYLPGRKVYEYPYTPENFPWFYDKELWIRYLDMLVENRMNSLYLWNGHPFASLVKLEDYPYAVEVDEETFKKNEEMFRFLTEEADKRGIWVIQMFYNIIVSKPFAEKHGLETQDRSRPIVPVIADYTRKSIAAFIEKYPNVGLLVALGEAMNTVEDDVEWFTGTVIPGVKDGLKALGRTDEPPILLRAHDTDASRVMEHALPLYKNLYTMHKYNGESLTTYEPRGPWSQIHKDLSSLGSVHISNVHILANLEPFRYGSPAFIRKSVQAMHKVHGANGLHLYPQTSYWDWPYTADKLGGSSAGDRQPEGSDQTGNGPIPSGGGEQEAGSGKPGRLLQIDRDWIWYKAWGRYAWKADRDPEQETAYWTGQLGDFYGCGEYGKDILEAYDEDGEIAPKLLRRFGITEGNRQTLLLGMFMSQLVNPYKWRVYPDFYESCGPEGEILIDYAEKEWKGEPHTGETPPQIIREVTGHARRAAEAIERAAPHVRENREEFERLKNDVYCYRAFADFFAEKVKAAMPVLRYQYSGDIADLDKAVPLLEKSLEHYRELSELAGSHYFYANSMQTAQRRIPIGGNDGKNKTWAELLPHYEKELENFKRNIRRLKSAADGEPAGLVQEDIRPWKPAAVELTGGAWGRFSVQTGEKVYTDLDASIKRLAPELSALSGWRVSADKQEDEGTSIRFTNDKPVRLVVGYFNTQDNDYLYPPTLETNASANDRGQAEAVIVNALEISDMPPVNVHTYEFEPGENKLDLGEGTVLLLGFADASREFKARDAGIIGAEQKEAIDWLFY